MKRLLRVFVQRTAKFAPFWFLYQKCRTISTYLMQIYTHARATREGSLLSTEDFVKRSFPDLTIKNGVFQGMRYPSSQSAGSALLPKLLGSYEFELHDLLTKIINTNYTDIVDIGCAEGYYAVGLGMKMPSAKVYAFDINPHARKLCLDMAQLNHTSDKLLIGGWCDESTLLSMKFSGRALILSDCEGYEKILFTQKVAEFLSSHDILIEVHDLIDLEISTRLRDVFRNTHDIAVITSIDDVKKVKLYDFKELEQYSLRERLTLMAEYRGAEMEWFFLTPKMHRDERALQG